MARSWKTFYVYALERGARHDSAEDFAQEACLYEFNGRRTEIRNLWVDFLRKTVAGRSDAKNYEARRNLFETIHLTPETREYGDSLEIEERRLETILLRDMSTAERAMVMLEIKWGFTHREVAEVLGVTESRICHLSKGLAIKLRGNC